MIAELSERKKNFRMKIIDSIIEFGIDPSIIKIHPEDYFDANRNQLIELGYDVNDYYLYI